MRCPASFSAAAAGLAARPQRGPGCLPKGWHERLLGLPACSTCPARRCQQRWTATARLIHQRPRAPPVYVSRNKGCPTFSENWHLNKQHANGWLPILRKSATCQRPQKKRVHGVISQFPMMLFRLHICCPPPLPEFAKRVCGRFRRGRQPGSASTYALPASSGLCRIDRWTGITCQLRNLHNGHCGVGSFMTTFIFGRAGQECFRTRYEGGYTAGRQSATAVAGCRNGGRHEELKTGFSPTRPLANVRQRGRKSASSWPPDSASFGHPCNRGRRPLWRQAGEPFFPFARTFLPPMVSRSVLRAVAPRVLDGSRQAAQARWGMRLAAGPAGPSCQRASARSSCKAGFVPAAPSWASLQGATRPARAALPQR